MKTTFLTALMMFLALFSHSQSFVQNQLSNCAYTGDINGDGIADIVTINDRQLTVSRPDQNLTPILTHTFPVAVKRVILGDFANSGRERGKKQVAAVLNDGNTMVFAIGDDQRSLRWWFTQENFITDNEQFAVANFDSDIAEEILIHNPTNGQIRFFKRGDNGRFASMTNFELGNLAGTNLVSVQVLAGSFFSDHPGRKDLLIVDHVARQMKLYGSVLLPNGNLTFWWAFTTNGNLFPAGSQVCIANIDGGQKDGIIVRNGSNNSYSLYKAEYGNGNLVTETSANIGQVPIRSGNCRIVAAKVRDAAFRNERGGTTRDDILVVQLSNNQLTRTDARFDGTKLTYWWAYNNTLPGACAQLVVATNRTAFDPVKHGFKFVNRFSVQPIFEVRLNGFCGGMTYAALDYFNANRPIPNQDWKPANKTPLFNYLWGRQSQTNSNNLDKWVELRSDPFGWRDSEFFNWGLQAFNGGRIEELKSEIDNGRPVPIGLHKGGKGTAGDHWVLAIGYDMGRYQGNLGNYKEDFKIFVCDPNYPNETLTLTPNPAKLNYYYVERPEISWMTYFVDKKYRPATPPDIPQYNFPNDGLVRMLLLDIETGDDDLRGENNENVNVTVNFTNGTSKRVNNINSSGRWIGHYEETLPIMLDQPIRADQLEKIVFNANMAGGIGGDNWDMACLKVIAKGGNVHEVLYHRRGSPLNRFKGDRTPFSVNLKGSELAVRFVTGGDDLRGGNDNVHVVLLQRMGAPKRFDNVNNGIQWGNGSNRTIYRTLPSSFRIENLAGIRLETTFGGGIGGDNWNLDELEVSIFTKGSEKKVFYKKSTPLFRFTGSQKSTEFRF